MTIEQKITEIFNKPAGVKSVQRGTTAYLNAQSANTRTITIAAVDPSKTIVLLQTQANTAASILGLVMLELTNSTTLTQYAHSGSATSWVFHMIHYQVIEFY